MVLEKLETRQVLFDKRQTWIWELPPPKTSQRKERDVRQGNREQLQWLLQLGAQVAPFQLANISLAHCMTQHAPYRSG